MTRWTCGLLILCVISVAVACKKDGNDPPSVPVVSDDSTETINDPPSFTFEFIWDPSTDPNGDDIEYYAELYSYGGIPTFPFDFENDGTLYESSGWISDTTWTVADAPFSQFYVFRVRARDEHGAKSDWGVYENDMLGSCPFLFSWDGEQYAFESDLFPHGRLGTRGSAGYIPPYPIDYYVLTTEPQPIEGAYELQMTGERDEVDYVDEVQLLALYYPDDREIVAERAPLGARSFPGVERIHTVAWPLGTPERVVHVNTGEDVTATLSAMDESFVTLNDDPDIGYQYQTLEVDLGNVSGAEQIKLVIDGRAVYPRTAEGAARTAEFGPLTILEVPDEHGDWVEVPRATVELPNLTAFRRVIVLDVTEAFMAGDHRMRLTWLYKSLVDAVLVDTSVDEPVRVIPLELQSADLHYRGYSGQTLGEVYDLIYDAVSPFTPEYFDGAYTRYGDVTGLLDRSDDLFAIFFGGDEITLRFDPADPPEEGERLGFAFMSNGYYKDARIDIPATVEPLPFAAMSNYPYDEATESYPDDAEHARYRETWNTRVHGEPAPTP